MRKSTKFAGVPNYSDRVAKWFVEGLAKFWKMYLSGDTTNTLSLGSLATPSQIPKYDQEEYKERDVLATSLTVR